MSQTDASATIRAAEAAGARIQAYTTYEKFEDDESLTLDEVMGYGYWRTLTEPTQFTCHISRYRVHPEDVAHG